MSYSKKSFNLSTGGHVMDTFKNKLSNEKFNSTNYLWNSLGLNKAWSVGYITTLIKQKNFKNKEEWYSYYFESGEQRLTEISKLNDLDANLLRQYNPSNNKNLNKLNYNFGRTKLEIASKGSCLYSEIVKTGNPYNLTEMDCQYIAYYRVICETWNGILCRELNTKQNIINTFAKNGYEILIIDTTGKFDYKYGIDFELYFNGHIICGLQIKPNSYKGNTKYIKEVKKINEVKNNKYKNMFNRNVYYIFSDEYGNIENKKVFSLLLEELKSYVNILSI